MFVTSAGTLTTFPLILYCRPLGAAYIFMNGKLGDNNLYSNGYKPCDSLGISGKFILFSRAQREYLSCLKCDKHAQQIHSLLFTLTVQTFVCCMIIGQTKDIIPANNTVVIK